MKTEELLNQENGEAISLSRDIKILQQKIDKLHDAINVKRKKLKEI